MQEGLGFGGKHVENSHGEGLIRQQRVCLEGGCTSGLQEESNAGMNEVSELLALNPYLFSAINRAEPL